MSSTPGPAMEFLGRIAYEFHQIKPLLPTYLHLLVSAIFPIYTAAHASLARPPSAAPANKKKNVNVADLQDEEISPTIETLTASDALLFPVLAGVTLTSLYLIIKWLEDPALLNYYLGLYFAFVGLYFNVKFVKDALATVRSFVLPNQYSYRGTLWKVDIKKQHFVASGGTLSTDVRLSPFPGIFSVLFKRGNSIFWSTRKFVYTKLNLKFSLWKLVSVTNLIDTLDLAAIIIATPLVYYHTFIDKPWFLTNFLGFSFCYGSLQMTTPGTSYTGSLLLSALFFYDIYFVFFTPMMVTVATKLDVPIKLLFPRPDGCKRPLGVSIKSKAWQDYLQCLAKKRTMAMLGLGDIVIPGMMLAFALRFDLYLYYRKLSSQQLKDTGDENDTSKKAQYSPATGSWGERFWTAKNLHTSEIKAKQFPKTYFHASVVGYVLGMIVTMLVMQVYQHAQPALLYLVPGVLISLWGVALVKGDLKALWNYSEVPKDEKSDEDKKKTKPVGDKKDGVDEKDGQKQIQDNESVKDDKKTENAVVEPTKSTDGDKTISKKQTKSNKNDNKVFYLSLTIADTNGSTSKSRSRSKSPSTPDQTSTPKITNNTSKRPSTSSWDSDSWPDSTSDSEPDTKTKDKDTEKHNDSGVKDANSSSKATESSGSVHGRVESGSAGEPAVKRRRKA